MKQRMQQQGVLPMLGGLASAALPVHAKKNYSTSASRWSAWWIRYGSYQQCCWFWILNLISMFYCTEHEQIGPSRFWCIMFCQTLNRHTQHSFNKNMCHLMHSVQLYRTDFLYWLISKNLFTHSRKLCQQSFVENTGI